jgi:Tfp pilus assembly protein FimT
MTRRAERKSRTAFSLMEVLLVLAILVAIGAVVAPSLGDAFLRQRLLISVDRLRSDWDRARLTAMKTGQTQAFTCVLGQRDYSIQPYMMDADLMNASAGALVTTSGGTVAEATSVGTLEAPEPTAAADGKQLDEDITFVSCAVSADMRSVSIAQVGGGLAATSMANQMVLFYPDGSTSTAEVIIQNPKGTQRAVRMRGLTGSTQVLTPGQLPVVAPATPGAP